MQIPLIYQTKKDLYCVQAQYKAINPKDLSVSPSLHTQRLQPHTHTVTHLTLQPSAVGITHAAICREDRSRLIDHPLHTLQHCLITRPVCMSKNMP